MAENHVIKSEVITNYVKFNITDRFEWLGTDQNKNNSQGHMD